ncbi:LXG domain of WXG superfamily protein [Streptococcus gallolyticus]|uniref:LXG domain of WXG superfamily protein n=1 Tax=Streptococcus gallolyticus TaxID=315405 RepID=A0A1I7GQW0_9STRE|nr:T7SS effector LXG polymorphic toxin [Streptococcus gallolyticus]SFC45129.1 LXG domain of WXG superfamily protein [Streptococcus gallolyticus]SFU50789.1 LXG domain of WXG superfamily protein [Streptococcus gallolyticus]
MGLNMTLEQSQAQAESVASVSQAQIEGYQALQQAIQQFADDTESLTGKAYEAAKAYYRAVLLPLAQGGELYAEMLAKASAKLPENYQESVDTKSWSEEQLLEYIRQEEDLINQLDEINQSLSRLELPTTQKRQMQQGTVDLIRGHHANKRVYETILEDLRAYSTDSVRLFDELDDIALQLSTGLAQAETSWNATDKSFTIPSDLSWATYLSAYSATKNLELSREERAFVNTMMTEYGFDVETAKQLLTIKRGIDSQFSYFAGYTSQERDYLFLRLIGAVSYDGVKWDETAGYLSSYFYEEAVGINNVITGDTQKVPMSLLEIFQVLGLSEQEAKELTYNLRLQHEMAGGNYGNSDYLKDTQKELYNTAKSTYKSIYGSAKGFDDFWDEHLKAYSNNGTGNADFTHQSITMATHLNPSGLQLSDFYGGREHVKALAGWEGDTTYNANDEKPSIGEDDYKADLDAVNIVGRMAQGQSYERAMSGYYSDVTKDETVREKEFLKNEDWDKVKSTIYASLVPVDIRRKGEEATRNYIFERYEGVPEFLDRLEAVAGE